MWSAARLAPARCRAAAIPGCSRLAPCRALPAARLLSTRPQPPAPPAAAPASAPVSTDTTIEALRYAWSVLMDSGSPTLRWRAAGALGLMIGAKLATIQVPFLFKHAVDGLSEPLAAVGGEGAALLALGPTGLMLAYGATKISADGMQQLRNALFASVTEHALRRMSRETFSHLLQLELRFHLSRQTGMLARTVERGTKAAGTLLSTSVLHVLPTAFEVSVVSGLLAYHCGPVYAAVTLGTLGTYAAFTITVTRVRAEIRRAQNRAENVVSGRFTDSMLNYETVKYCDARELEEARYDESLRGYQSAALRTALSLAGLNFGQSLIFASGLAASLTLAANGVLAGAMSVGDVVMVHGLIFQLGLPLNILGTVYNSVRQASIDMTALSALLRIEPQVGSAPGAPPLALSGGAIEFENVTFGYSKEAPLLHDISFKLDAGQTLAIVGGSGSGKSTLLRLIYRFYDVDEGSVRVDGQDVRRVDVDSLRRAIAVVPQDVVLFNESVGYNIGYGRPGASDDEVRRAAQQACIDEAIARMPSGYDTVVGERGLKLSGGEKQRVAIARAMLKGAPLLLADEATSAIDSVTEAHVLGELRALARSSDSAARKTCVVIAHRLSTVMDADVILVLRKGRVAEMGAHTELLARRGEYARLWSAQSSSASHQFEANSEF